MEVALPQSLPALNHRTTGVLERSHAVRTRWVVHVPLTAASPPPSPGSGISETSPTLRSSVVSHFHCKCQTTTTAIKLPTTSTQPWNLRNIGHIADGTISADMCSSLWLTLRIQMGNIEEDFPGIPRGRAVGEGERQGCNRQPGAAIEPGHSPQPIHQFPNSVHRTIQNVENAAEAGKKLKTIYQPPGSQAFYRFMREAMNIKMGHRTVELLAQQVENLWTTFERLCRTERLFRQG
ncbi:MAG: hypothetical protein M1826_002288 [Phylliscum demangeonii]|nr:MAG: hypothetical protein M1826_002288 [Phylliscum demangeonii]